MTDKRSGTLPSRSRVLGLIWLVVAAGLAYPAYTLLVSIGFNEALSAVAVFIGACLLYEIPYRARLREQQALALQRTNRWRG